MYTFFAIRQSTLITVSMTVVGVFCVGVATALGAPAQYTPLVGIPELGTAQGSGLAAYLNRIYVVLIALGAIIAFIKISIAGVKWSMDDIVTHKAEAKEDIKGALLGLAILLIPFIVLNTIYPNLTNLNILGNAGELRVDLKRPTSAAGSGTRTSTSTGTANPYYNDVVSRQNDRIIGACDRADGVYDPVTKICSDPPTTDRTHYTRDQLTSALNDEWKARCAEGKLRTAPTPDRGRDYWCAP